MKAIADCHGRGKIFKVAASISLPEIKFGGCSDYAVKNESYSLVKLIYFPLQAQVNVLRLKLSLEALPGTFIQALEEPHQCSSFEKSSLFCEWGECHISSYLVGLHFSYISFW